MKLENQKQILGCMANVLNQNGFQAQLMQSTEENMPLLLRCDAPRQGKVQMDVSLECCFISMPLPNEESGLLQCFVSVFSNAPEANMKLLKAACDYCNGFSALGSFGVYEEAGQVYLKYNTLMDGSWELEKIITFFADTISLLMASVTRFIDGLASVGFSGVPLAAALEQDLFPKL